MRENQNWDYGVKISFFFEEQKKEILRGYRKDKRAKIMYWVVGLCLRTISGPKIAK